METIGSPLLWTAFAVVVVVALLVDLVLMRHGGPHKVTFKEATWWSLGWVALAMAFNVWLWWHAGQQFGPEAGNRIGMEFLTGYLVEKSLAVDNIFVFLMIFSYFAVPEEQKQRVLVIGIIAAIVLRAILIFAGALLLAKFHWILYVFGAFLLLTGIKMVMAAGKAPDLEKNPVLRWLTGHVPMTRSYHDSALSILQDGKRLYTPLFIVIVMIGITDVIFAVDSIPAIFAITDDPFIVLTSNVFAVLGLRAMFFLLQGMADRFHLLPYGLALVLMFIGAKMLLIDVYKIPITLSLGVVAATIGTTIALSLLRPQKTADPREALEPARGRDQLIGMSTPLPTDAQAQRQHDRQRLRRALNASLAFVLVLAACFTAQQGFDWTFLTVTPGSWEGLLGVLTAPLLHGSVEHIVANGTALLMLGTLAGTTFPKATLRALPLLWVGSGLVAWVLGQPGSHHLGASGVTHGLGFLLFVLGLLRRDRAAIAAGMLAFLFYGGMLMTILPREAGVSWESHLGGALGGVLAAFLFRHSDPMPLRAKYSWEIEEELAREQAARERDMYERRAPGDVPVLWQRDADASGERGKVLPFRRPGE